MNEFLDRIWFANTLRSYFIVIIIISVVIVIKRYIAWYIAGLIFHFVKSVWQDVDKKTFTSLVAKPLGFFLVILVAVSTLYELNFPEELNVNIYRVTAKELFQSIGSLILIISFIRLLLRIIDFISIILQLRAARNTDNQLIVFFKDFFKVLLSVVGFLMILKFSFGFKIGNLLTGFSLVAAAIALALRESMENLIASFIIFFDKPFSMGDVVKVQNFTGTVEKIGLRSTRIRTEQKTFITVPNKQMVDSILDNLSLRTQRKGELRLELSLSTPSDLLDQLITGIRNITGQKEIENATILLNDITSSAFVILVDYFTAPVTAVEFNVIKEQINFEILRLMEELKVELAGAGMNNFIKKKGDLV